MNVKWLEPVQKWKGELGKYKYVLLVIAVGVVLLMLPMGKTTDDQTKYEQTTQTDSFDLDAFEEKLAQVLSQIGGAGRTQVVLTLDSGSRQVLAQDQDRGGDGSVDSSTVTVGRGSGSQEVVPLQTLAPNFRGALVVCPGGGDPQVRLKLVEAVSALTGLGADRISICEGNT
ncbi:MAG: stage III sporulation protein AG [Lawsonibacter sp.]